MHISLHHRKVVLQFILQLMTKLNKALLEMIIGLGIVYLFGLRTFNYQKCYWHYQHIRNPSFAQIPTPPTLPLKLLSRATSPPPLPSNFVLSFEPRHPPQVVVSCHLTLALSRTLSPQPICSSLPHHNDGLGWDGGYLGLESMRAINGFGMLIGGLHCWGGLGWICVFGMVIPQDILLLSMGLGWWV